MLKIKEMIIRIRFAGPVTSRKKVISIVTVVLQANNPSLLPDFGANVNLTDMRTNGVLIFTDLVKRKETTGKGEPQNNF